MGLHCAVSNIWPANCPFSQSETALRRTVTVEVRLRSTKTQPTYNICCRGGRRDWCPTSTAPEIIYIQMVTHPDINPVQQCLTSVNRREQVFPFGASRTRRRLGQSRSGRLITNSVYTWVSKWDICILESPQETRFYASRIHEFNLKTAAHLRSFKDSAPKWWIVLPSFFVSKHEKWHLFFSRKAFICQYLCSKKISRTLLNS